MIWMGKSIRHKWVELQVPESGTIGRPIQVDVSFLNPLPVTLTNCELRIESPTLEKAVIYKQPYVLSFV